MLQGPILVQLIADDFEPGGGDLSLEFGIGKARKTLSHTAGPWKDYIIPRGGNSGINVYCLALTPTYYGPTYYGPLYQLVLHADPIIISTHPASASMIPKPR